MHCMKEELYIRLAQSFYGFSIYGHSVCMRKYMENIHNFLILYIYITNTHRHTYRIIIIIDLYYTIYILY